MAMPNTLNGLCPFVCVSAVQKFIRRSQEKEAMQFAVEMVHTSKAFTTMLCNRLEVITHEDLDSLTQPHVIPFVRTCCEQAKEKYDLKKIGESRLYIGSAIRMMSAAKKSRKTCHFSASIGLASQMEGFVPVAPDWVFDVHTQKGKAMGRGLEHFLEEGALLIPAPDEDDEYLAEAKRLWAYRYKS